MKIYSLIGRITCFLFQLSLMVYPYWFTQKLKRLRNLILSKRFESLTKSDGKAWLQFPIYIKGHKYIHYLSIFSGPGLRLECWDEYHGQKYSPSISLGRNVVFNWHCHIGAIDRIEIGNNVLIGSHVLITDHSHGCNSEEDIDISPLNRNLFSKGPVIIEDNVWIGENVCILPNVRIGRNSIIGANSVVTKNVPSFSIVAGNPSKILKLLKHEQ